MRRSRFAKAIEVNEVRERASIGDALWFDVTKPDTSDEESLCEWRLAGLQHAPLILGVTHLLIATAFVFLSHSIKLCVCSDNPLIASSVAIAVDVAMAVLLFTRKRVGMAPQTGFRFLAAYLGLSGLLWTWFGYTVADDSFVTPLAEAPIAMAAGIAMRTVVSISSPPLALVNMVVSIAAAAILAGSPLVPGGVAIL